MNCLHVKIINKGILHSLAKPNTFFFFYFVSNQEYKMRTDTGMSSRKIF